MANRDYYIDPGKEADDFVKAFVAMSKSIQDSRYNQVRLEYYRALTKKALSKSGNGFLSSPEGQKWWDEKVLKPLQPWLGSPSAPAEPTPKTPAPKDEPVPKEPAPKPRSEAEPAPTTPKAAETPTTPAPSKTAALSDSDTALPESDAPASPQLAAGEPVTGEAPSLFEDDKAIPA